MTNEEIKDALFQMRDAKYAEFHARLIPTIDPQTVIGVRTPALRKYAKELAKTGEAATFLQTLPHRYYDENQLHAFLIAEETDFSACLAKTEAFLPYIDNWATCDQLSPKALRKDREALLCRIKQWIVSPHTYTVRFAIGMLMQHFLDDAFSPEYPAMVAAVQSDEYYINMMCAWYFATAMTKQYDAVICYIAEQRLSPWVHQKTIQKCVESFRISPEQKTYLKTFRTHKNNSEKV